MRKLLVSLSQLIWTLDFLGVWHWIFCEAMPSDYYLLLPICTIGWCWIMKVVFEEYVFFE